MRGIYLHDTCRTLISPMISVFCLLEDADVDEHLLDSVVHAVKHVGLRMNASKTNFCSNDRNIDITCSGEQLERVEKVTYLGSSIQPNGDITG